MADDKIEAVLNRIQNRGSILMGKRIDLKALPPKEDLNKLKSLADQEESDHYDEEALRRYADVALSLKQEGGTEINNMTPQAKYRAASYIVWDQHTDEGNHSKAVEQLRSISVLM